MLIQEMSHEECFAALAQSRLGRLGCAYENQPYVVPIYFALERSKNGEPYLYGFTTPGQKIEWMRANPLVCVEWDEVASYDRWASVIVFGRYEELPVTSEGGQEGQKTRAPARAAPWHYSPENEQERTRALALLQEYAVWWQPGYAAYVARDHDPTEDPYSIVYYRIRIDKITGHRATPRAVAEKAAGPQSA
jgi:uncharacterized protein